MQTSVLQQEERAKTAWRLNQPQERELARLWRRNGDQAARNRLVQSQLGYVRTVARRCNRSGTSIDELLAEGTLGLMHAANRFDPESGYRFFTYAKHWVRVYVFRSANRCSSVVGRGSQLLSKVRRECARAASLVGEGLEAREMIAERLNLNHDEVEALLCALEQREVSFEALAPDEIARGSQLRADEVDPEQSLLQHAERVQRRALVSKALGMLDKRERRIAVQRLMADSDAMLTLQQLGREFGVSGERVRQLEERLKQKLACQLRPLAEPDGCGFAA